MPSRDYSDPSVEYTPIPDADIAVGQPITSFLMGELRDGAYHCRDVCYDPDRHTPVLAHDHDGRNSAHLVSAPNTPNLISAGMLSPLFSVSIFGASFAKWIFKDAQYSAEGVLLSSAGQWALHTLVDRDRPPWSLGVFGGRCDVVLSCYLKASASLEDGLLAIGLVDTGDDPEGGNIDFPEGMKVYIPATVITTDWVRIWAVLDNVGNDWTKESVRLGIKCINSPKGGHVVANGFDVRPGRSLDYYVHGYHSDVYDGFQIFANQYLPPVLDESISITNAIKLAAV